MTPSIGLSPALELSGITKNFGATRALEDVDFRMIKGQVHALLGENGAGKSTLVKILSGALKADKGDMSLNGRPYHPADPLEGRRCGVSMIYQELNLAPHLTVEENVMLGKEVHAVGFLKRRGVRKKIHETLEFLHHPEIAPDTPVRKLSLGARQVVEICRAILDRADILIMDEPTSSLTQEDTDRLFQVIRKMKSEGVSIIYISHFLEEVREIADNYTVLRDGRHVGSGRMSDASLEEIIQLMVGKKMKDLFPQSDRRLDEVILSLKNLKGGRMPESVGLDLHRGEILGLAGLIGSGRTETLRTIFGLDLVKAGTVTIGGVKVIKGKPWFMIERRAGLLSEDRQAEGLAQSRSLEDNITLSHFTPYKKFGFLRLKKRSQAVSKWMETLNIKAQSLHQPVSSLSGGTQQKVALARLLHQDADVLLLDEPTRGIDVLSKSQIYEWMSELASKGKSLLFVSSYFPELLGVCDRIAAFFRGRVAGVRPARDWSEESLMTATTTGKA
jgi:ribose transport system ATP-binding protein